VLLKFVIKKKGTEMQKYLLLLSYMIIIIIIGCSTKDNDWDYYDEGLTEMQISDLSHIGVGHQLNSEPPEAIVDLVKMEISITHAEPSNLEIKLIYDYDTLLIWDNDYPGGIQELEPDYFVGKPANVYWGLSIYDEVEDGNEGWLKKFTLMIKYQ